MAGIRNAMTRELDMALRALEKMDPPAVGAAERLILDLGSIKQQIEDRAVSLGYSKRCRESIAVCRGECCRWHFPKTINRVDFFVAVFQSDAAATAALVEQVQSKADRPYCCPLLRKDGCLFTFESRPVVCTSAFPCLAGAGYWQYKERFRKDIDALRAALGSLVDTCAAGPL